ncbi:hypothetical protein K2173_007099 [Erythroxylum novogranatense]|uniref:TIR domain-containing protein n=1 Tax=Erythroxylum novogranatense TaxID=1862640 RepID=A0AAV8SYC0_9ROSI|nr:hypothetical protein K2173_007099 [Erythroxylum novogranatense]
MAGPSSFPSLISSSFPSSTTHQEKHDVFLSFRGQDTRKSLTSHLFAALEKAKIQTFMDNDGLDRGEAIAPSLLKAIEESKVSVIIFSQNYADSRWCLDELVKIMECKKNNGQIAIPVFYQVSASNVRHQTKSYEQAFDKLKQCYDDDKIQKWRDVLKEAADISGWSSSSSGDDSKLIEQLVRYILNKLNRLSPIECSNLVGIDSPIKEVQSILRMNDSQSVVIVGIWGMGGSGKTAIAGAVFNQIYMQFDGFHFLSNVREELKRRNEADLRNKVISNILEEENLKLNTPNLEQAFIKDRLRRKKVLLVLDNVDDSVALENLLGEPSDLFGRGSRIIITSRDRRVLKSVTDEIYEVQRLEIDEALELFSLSAFKAKYPPSDYMQKSMRVINDTECNPLALKVLGSALYKVSKEEWQSKQEKLDSDPRIQNMTRSSYDGLTRDQKGIFLDIAYFFEGEDRDYVTKVLETSYSSVHYDICVLIDKSLVTISNKKIEMHVLILDMGLNIVREAESGSRSRLWTYEEICDALTGKKGNEVVEGIILDISQTKELKLDSDAFKGMNHLRLLKFYVPASSMGCGNEVNLAGGKLSLCGKLSYLHWYRYPLQFLPNNFCAENLVELNLPYSKVEELALGKQDLPKLKWVDLRRSEYLYKISGLSRAINLESLVLQGCTRLRDLDQSIQYLEKTEHLDLAGCEELTSFPKTLGSKSIKFLDLSYCFNIRDCPEISGQMEELDLSWTAIEHVHPSIQQLKCLRVLRLNGCSHVTKFPVISESIEELYLGYTAIEELPSSIKFLTRLAKLDIGNCWKLSNLVDNIYPLKYLKEMHSSGTATIKSIPNNLYNFASLSFHEARKTKEKLATKTKGLVSGISSYRQIKGFLPEFPSVSSESKSKEEAESSKTTKAKLPAEIDGESKKGLLTRVPRVFGGSKTKASPTKDPSALSSKILDDLGCLLLLKHLILKRMDFESLPSSIKHLTQLQLIDLSKCKRLKSLPELPPSLEILDADNCTSLESLFSSINFRYLNLENCRKLDQKTHREIMENIQSIIQRMARKSLEEAYPVQFLFPGSEMPPLSYNQTNVGSSLTMQWPSDWTKFNGIVFCMLFGPEEGSGLLNKVNEAASPSILSFGCKCCIKANEGAASNVICEWERSFGHLNLAKSDHVLTWYDPCRETTEGGSDDEIEWFKKYSGRKISFEFQVETFLCFSSQCTIKKSGILLLQNDTTGTRMAPRLKTDKVKCSCQKPLLIYKVVS